MNTAGQIGAVLSPIILPYFKDPAVPLCIAGSLYLVGALCWIGSRSAAGDPAEWSGRGRSRRLIHSPIRRRVFPVLHISTGQNRVILKAVGYIG